MAVSITVGTTPGGVDAIVVVNVIPSVLLVPVNFPLTVPETGVPGQPVEKQDKVPEIGDSVDGDG